jgi:excisionase family DNA binding protein
MEALETSEAHDSDKLLKPGVVAGLFGVSPRTVSNWVARGKLSARRTAGGHRRYRESEVRALLAELELAA